MTREEIDIFLEKGLLEQYAIGDCSPDEEREVETMLKSSEELRNEYAEIQFYLEKLASTKAKPLPPQLLDDIQSAIAAEENKAGADNTPVRSIERKRSFDGWKVAASIALLLATGLVFFQMQKNNALQAELNQLSNRQNDLIAQNQAMKAELDGLENHLAFVEHSRTQKYILNTKFKGQEFVLATYWNDFAEKALVDPKEIPSPPEGHCFQLWADVHGEMVPVAIITKEQLQMLEGRFYQEAESLNVTIEEAGGAEHPNLEQFVTSVEV